MASKKMLKAALENTLEGHDLSAIDAVIAGINAAPIARDDDSWTVMVDPQMSSDLKVKLQERRAFRM